MFFLISIVSALLITPLSTAMEMMMPLILAPLHEDRLLPFSHSVSLSSGDFIRMYYGPREKSLTFQCYNTEGKIKNERSVKTVYAADSAIHTFTNITPHGLARYYNFLIFALRARGGDYSDTVIVGSFSLNEPRLGVDSTFQSLPKDQRFRDAMAVITAEKKLALRVEIQTSSVIETRLFLTNQSLYDESGVDDNSCDTLCGIM